MKLENIYNEVITSIGLDVDKNGMIGIDNNGTLMPMMIGNIPTYLPNNDTIGSRYGEVDGKIVEQKYIFNPAYEDTIGARNHSKEKLIRMMSIRLSATLSTIVTLLLTKLKGKDANDDIEFGTIATYINKHIPFKAASVTDVTIAKWNSLVKRYMSSSKNAINITSIAGATVDNIKYHRRAFVYSDLVKDVFDDMAYTILKDLKAAKKDIKIFKGILDYIFDGMIDSLAKHRTKHNLPTKANSLVIGSTCDVGASLDSLIHVYNMITNALSKAYGLVGVEGNVIDIDGTPFKVTLPIEYGNMEPCQVLASSHNEITMIGGQNSAQMQADIANQNMTQSVAPVAMNPAQTPNTPNEKPKSFWGKVKSKVPQNQMYPKNPLIPQPSAGVSMSPAPMYGSPTEVQMQPVQQPNTYATMQQMEDERRRAIFNATQMQQGQQVQQSGYPAQQPQYPAQQPQYPAQQPQYPVQQPQLRNVQMMPSNTQAGNYAPPLQQRAPMMMPNQPSMVPMPNTQRVPAQPQYGAPMAPMQPQYGAPAQPQYGVPMAPMQPQYGAPAQPQYGAPMAPAWGPTMKDPNDPWG